MNIAQASLEELRYYFILARDLGYIATDREMRRPTKSPGCWARTSATLLTQMTAPSTPAS